MKVLKIFIFGLCVMALIGCSSFFFHEKADAVMDYPVQLEESSQDASQIGESGSTKDIALDTDSITGNNVTMQSVYEFGAIGDGLTDDTDAIQKALNSEQPVYFPRTIYVVTRPIIITNKKFWSMYAQDATFLYTGSDYTFKILYAENCHIEIGQIYASEGGGIEFYSDSPKSWSQYVYLSFNSIECKTDCIHIEATNGGWSSENQVYGGRFKAGINGVHLLHTGRDYTNGWKFYNCGIEGVNNGFLFNAGNGFINDMVIVNPRYEESYETVLKTKGKVFNCLWIATSVFKSEEIKCSGQTTQFEVLAPIGNQGHRGCIIDGKLMVEKTEYEELQ